MTDGDLIDGLLCPPNRGAPTWISKAGSTLSGEDNETKSELLKDIPRHGQCLERAPHYILLGSKEEKPNPLGLLAYPNSTVTPRFLARE